MLMHFGERKARSRPAADGIRWPDDGSPGPRMAERPGGVPRHRAMGKRRNESRETPDLLHLLDLERIPDLERWPGRRRSCRSHAHVKASGPVTSASKPHRCLASRAEPTAKRAHHLVRQPWDIQNGLHRALERPLYEDRARRRNRNCAANFSLVGTFALHVIKQEGTLEPGGANKRKRAGCDQSYLMTVVTGIHEAQTARALLCCAGRAGPIRRLGESAAGSDVCTRSQGQRLSCAPSWRRSPSAPTSPRLGCSGAEVAGSRRSACRRSERALGIHRPSCFTSGRVSRDVSMLSHRRSCGTRCFNHATC